MRQVVLDTETTGLEVRQGHRLIEIACVELIDRHTTSRHYQTYLNPDRQIDEGARQVTGIEDAFLLDKPRFAEVVEDFLSFIDGAELIIHNASFDVGFLNAELARAGGRWGSIATHCSVLDTLAMARERYPGQRNSLDALCKRLGVDNSRRELHSGLIDAQLLADVYLAMTSGQVALDLGFDGPETATEAGRREPMVLARRPRVLRATLEEQVQHEAKLAVLDESCGGESLWRQVLAEDAADVEL